jgi:uncharacterized membrane protein
MILCFELDVVLFCILLLCDEIGLINDVMIKTECKRCWLMFTVLNIMFSVSFGVLGYQIGAFREVSIAKSFSTTLLLGTLA